MSRIGKNPINIPAGVTITVTNDNVVTVKGPKGELTFTYDKLRDLLQDLAETGAYKITDFDSIIVEGLDFQNNSNPMLITDK